VPSTVTEIVTRTAEYLASEQIAGAQGAPASDLYVLGVVAYECLAGPDHLGALTTRHNIASWAGECGDAAQARPLPGRCCRVWIPVNPGWPETRAGSAVGGNFAGSG
jgi:hypothetical protein